MTSPLRVLWRQTRRNALMRQDDHCVYCGMKLITWLGSNATPTHTLVQGGVTVAYATLDHVIPLVCGGEDTITNTVLACAPCNREKGSMPVEIFVARKQVSK
jgi:5-methylcytosine-specific restriction endonuclease McrA